MPVRQNNNLSEQAKLPEKDVKNRVTGINIYK